MQQCRQRNKNVIFKFVEDDRTWSESSVIKFIDVLCLCAIRFLVNPLCRKPKIPEHVDVQEMRNVP
jgi:hypothetical protein